MSNATKYERVFSYDDILCFGKELGLSSNYVKDEIIGCLYANFITHKSEQYKLTERAVRDFSLYGSEVMYKTAEIPYTIDFLNKDIKISFYHLLGMQNAMAEQHKWKKWNYNRSLNRIMHKCKSIDAASELLASSLSIADSYLKLNHLSFTEFMREYGRKYSNSSQPIYSVNMNFRGLFKSESLDIFESIFLKIKENYINPVDWGGRPFGVDYQTNIINTANKLGAFLERVGINLIKASDSKYTETHQLFLCCSDAELERVFKRAIKYNITLNKKNMKLFTGIRLDVQGISRYKYSDCDLNKVAELFSLLYLEYENETKIKSMKYICKLHSVDV